MKRNSLNKCAPEKSDRQLAKAIGVSDKTVGAVRKELEESAEIPHFVARQDPRTGRLSQPASKPISIPVAKPQQVAKVAAQAQAVIEQAAPETVAKLAATELGFTELPCSVKDLDDIEANILLLSSNQQEGNDPLDIGLNALDTVEKAKGGRGVKSELSVSAFAKRLGKVQRYVSEVMNGARVYKKLIAQAISFDPTDRAKHLTEIHAAPESTWALLAGAIGGKRQRWRG